MKKSTQPAFPFAGPALGRFDPGMTLRDYFAGQILMGAATVTDADLGTVEDIAKACYKLADAMLAERSK